MGLHCGVTDPCNPIYGRAGLSNAIEEHGHSSSASPRDGNPQPSGAVHGVGRDLRLDRHRVRPGYRSDYLHDGLHVRGAHRHG